MVYTKEDIPNRSFSRFLVREPAFVGLKTGEPDCHLWNDTRQNCPETFVER